MNIKDNDKKYSIRKKKIFRFLLSAVLLIVLLLAAILEYLTLTEYKPEPGEMAAVDHGNWDLLKEGDTLKILTWNCGYGALGDNADFVPFYRRRDHYDQRASERGRTALFLSLCR